MRGGQHRRWFRVLAVLVGLLGSNAGDALAQPANITPKIVIQALSVTGVDAAGWTADSRFLVTAAGLSRELLIWDAEQRVIVDRLRLPAAPGASVESMLVQRVVISPAGVARVEGLVMNPENPVMMSGRAYSVNLQTRAVQIVAPPRVAEGIVAAELVQRWITALGVFTLAGKSDMSVEEAEAVLPSLPASPDGRLKLSRGNGGLMLQSAAGSPLPMTMTAPMVGFDDAALSPDGRRLALLDMKSDIGTSGFLETPVKIFDLLTGQFGAVTGLRGDYDDLRWLGADRFIAMETGDDDPADPDTAEGTPLPILVVEAATGAVRQEIPARCLVQPLPGGSLVGAGLANCRRAAGQDFALQRFDPAAGRWQLLPDIELAKGTRVALLAASPRGDRIAVSLMLPDASLELMAITLATGEIGPAFTLPAGTEVTKLAFSPDGRSVFLSADAEVLMWSLDVPGPDPEAVTIKEMAMRAFAPSMLVSDGKMLVAGGSLEEEVSRAALSDGAALPSLALANVINGGFVPGKPLFWAVSVIGELKLWNTRSWQPLVTGHFLANQKSVMVAADGRYDTNLGPDAAQFRWFMADEPWRSLPPQSFMRDYFEPRLLQKLTDCTVADNCARVLKPAPPIAGLNRQLPVVQITGVTSNQPGTAVVSIEVRETIDARSQQRSGVYGMKLLMGNREIARVPDEPYAATETLAAWRTANRSFDGDSKGVRRWEQTVLVPTDGRELEFEAYSFNSDRVKSDTARLQWMPPSMPARPRRAFVLTIGVDDYAESRLALNFAVADAKVIAQRLAALPGYEMRHTSLTSGRMADGRVRQVTREDIDKALGILAGFPPGPQREALAAAGHDASALDKATPDDIVVLSFSGHGHADAAGNFALLPSDTRWPAAAAPASDTVISAADLTMWLRAIAAGEIAFIIDACHSGASVQTPDFKPGPMGDPGLGQLAFDKGIRILAATQADDVALESASLRQGMLTAALGEGLTPAGGPADLDGDGRILLDEWLRYAVARLPSLNEEVRRGAGPVAARGVRLVMRTPSARPRVQEPSLFDFNARPSIVVLREKP